MVATPDFLTLANPTITWEPLPADFVLEEEPVEDTGQPLLAGALRESLELAGRIQPEMLIASNFGLCATVNERLVIKAPDWLYVARVNEPGQADRKAYTPNLEGEVPAVVMEFLSGQDGSEYSLKRTFPPGKWFFYERILQVPTYVIFDPIGGLLELYRLRAGRYELEQPDAEGRHWLGGLGLEGLGLFLGTWRGVKEEREGYWLRWWTADGELLPWAVERVAEAEAQAEAAREKAERLEAYLRAQGVDPGAL